MKVFLSAFLLLLAPGAAAASNQTSAKALMRSPDVLVDPANDRPSTLADKDVNTGNASSVKVRFLRGSTPDSQAHRQLVSYGSIWQDEGTVSSDRYYITYRDNGDAYMTTDSVTDKERWNYDLVTRQLRNKEANSKCLTASAYGSTDPPYKAVISNCVSAGHTNWLKQRWILDDEGRLRTEHQAHTGGLIGHKFRGRCLTRDLNLNDDTQLYMEECDLWKRMRFDPSTRFALPLGSYGRIEMLDADGDIWRMTERSDGQVYMRQTLTSHDPQDQYWSYDSYTRQLKNEESGKCLTASTSSPYYGVVSPCVSSGHTNWLKQRWFRDRNGQLRCEHDRFYKHCLQMSTNSNNLYMNYCDGDWNQVFYELYPGQLEISPTSSQEGSRSDGRFNFQVNGVSYYLKLDQSNAYMGTSSGAPMLVYYPDSMRLKFTSYNGDPQCLTADSNGVVVKSTTCYNSDDTDRFKQMWYRNKQDSSAVLQNAYYPGKCLTQNPSDGNLYMSSNCGSSPYRRVHSWSSGFWD